MSSSNNNAGSFIATYVPILNGSNYQEWESQMTAFLRSQGLWRIVNRMATHPDEATHADAANKWDVSDNMAQGQMTLCLDPIVVWYQSVRLLLALAALEDWVMEAVDVKTALLYGKLDEDIYMCQPEGFLVQGKEQLVWRLKCVIYGLHLHGGESLIIQ